MSASSRNSKPTPTPTPKLCYVYAYYSRNRACGKASIVYVGIGTENTPGDFSRARDFLGHAEVAAAHDADEIDVQVIARELTRKAARNVEGMLIRSLRPLGTLLNICNGTDSPKLVMKPKSLRTRTRPTEPAGPFVPKGTCALLNKSGCSLKKHELLTHARDGALAPTDFPKLTPSQVARLRRRLLDAQPVLTEGYEAWSYQGKWCLSEDGKSKLQEVGRKSRKYFEADALTIVRMQARLADYKKRGRTEQVDALSRELAAFKAKALRAYSAVRNS